MHKTNNFALTFIFNNQFSESLFKLIEDFTELYSGKSVFFLSDFLNILYKYHIITHESNQHESCKTGNMKSLFNI